MGNDKPEDIGPLTYEWFHWREEEGREQGAPLSLLDMPGTPVICNLAEVVSIYLFPKHIS